MWNRRLISLATLVSTVVLMLAITTVASACPTCKDGLGNDPHAANLMRGYFWSILFMMSMPFLILFGLGGYFYLEVRKARAGGLARQNPILQPSGKLVTATPVE